MISARELRNDYARVLRQVEAGEDFTVLSRGREVARIIAAGTGGAGEPDPGGNVVARGPRRGVRLGEVAGLNAAAGPFDHGAFRRAQGGLLDEVMRDPYASTGTQAPLPAQDAAAVVTGDATTEGTS